MVRILRNPFYAGVMVWNGQRRIGRHEAMITLPEHERILDIVASHNLGASRSRKHNFLLRGFVFCNRCGHRYTAEVHVRKHKSYYHCAARREHSNRRQNVEVSDLEDQVTAWFKEVEFSSHFVEAIVQRLTEASSRQRQTLGLKKQAICNQQKALEVRRDRAEEKLLAGVLSDDAFVRLRTNFTQQLQGLQEQLVTLDSQREFDTDLIRTVLALTTNIHQAYQKAPVALKRQYLGLFWERFVVEDREIVEAIPSRLIRDLQAQHPVILSSKGRRYPLINITWMLDQRFLSSLREKVDIIQKLQNQIDDPSFSSAPAQP